MVQIVGRTLTMTESVSQQITRTEISGATALEGRVEKTREGEDNGIQWQLCRDHNLA
ncbi:MAG: hypothetical protein Kow0074_17270 [Candidatus Zixiibacteriota bacterium]